jgi:hypothetical protein
VDLGKGDNKGASAKINVLENDLKGAMEGLVFCQTLSFSCFQNNYYLRISFNDEAISWLKTRSIKIRYIRCNRASYDIALEID